MMIENYLIIAIITAVILLILLCIFTFPNIITCQGKLLRNKKHFKQMQIIPGENVLQTQLEMKEQALRNISQELHDNIGHVLALVKLHLSSIQIRNNPLASGKIYQSIELLDRAVNDLRDLSKSMQADNIDKAGLTAAVKYDLELITQTDVIATSFKVEGTAIRLGIAREIVIYRLVQEALSNVIKHANATEIIVVFRFNEADFVVTIIDNGKGFNRQSIGRFNHNGAGINNMFSRARLIDGTLNIDSSPGCGTKINFTMRIQIGVNN